MTHDPLCVNSKGSCCPWMGECTCQCRCDEIEKIREDERTRWNSPYFSADYHKGYRQAKRDIGMEKKVQNEYMELPLYTEFADDLVYDIWVHTDGAPIVLKDVKTDPVRYQGWWNMEYTMVGHSHATAMISDEKVRYFTIVEHQKPEPS